jgi:ubiquinone/menaquinone biosynthesis C-methylase UbiE
MNNQAIKFKKMKFSNEYYSKRNKHHYEIMCLIRDMRPYEPKKILELGASCGYNNEAFKSYDYTGIEISDKQARLGRKRGLNIINGDIEERLPFKNNSFDCILCISTIEHIYNTYGLVKEVKRVLKKNGFAIFLTCNITSFHNRLMMLLGEKPPCIDSYRNGKVGYDHISLFSKYDIVNLFNEVGLRIDEIKGYDNGRILKYTDWITKHWFFLGLSDSLIWRARK